MELYSHGVEVVDVLDDDFSEQILFVHYRWVACTDEFSLHGSRVALRVLRAGRPSPCFRL